MTEIRFSELMNYFANAKIALDEAEYNHNKLNQEQKEEVQYVLDQLMDLIN